MVKPRHEQELGEMPPQAPPMRKQIMTSGIAAPSFNVGHIFRQSTANRAHMRANSGSAQTRNWLTSTAANWLAAATNCTKADHSSSIPILLQSNGSASS